MQSVIKALWKNQCSNTEEMKRHTFKSIHLKSYIPVMVDYIMCIQSLSVNRISLYLFPIYT